MMETCGGYRREPAGTRPPYAHAPYASTHKRAPLHPPIQVEQTLSEVSGPIFESRSVRPGEADLTRFDGGQALGERIIVTGRLLDGDGRPVRDSLIEIWQANSAGRYAHPRDRHDAPLDPHFSGVGRVVTVDNGTYRFLTIKPGAYPWQNHYNAWRPQHIHFSVFGPAFATRLITQMYFPGDPLLALDPIFNSIPADTARCRLIATFDISATVPEHALGYHFDIVLRGRDATPMEP